MDSDQDILEVELPPDGKRVLMSRLAVRLLVFPVKVVRVYQSATGTETTKEEA